MGAYEHGHGHGHGRTCTWLHGIGFFQDIDSHARVQWDGTAHIQDSENKPNDTHIHYLSVANKCMIDLCEWM